MDACLPDWNTEIEMDLPFSSQRKPLGVGNELVELLWQNGEVVLNSQNHRKHPMMKSRQFPSYKQHDHHHYHHHQSTISKTTSHNSIQDDIETVSWIDCPIDEAFEKEFCTNFLSEIPLDHPNNKPENDKFFDLPPPPRFETFSSAHQEQNLSNISNFQLPVKRNEIRECSTIGSSHCGSNQVLNDVDLSRASSCGIGYHKNNYGLKVNESPERETLEQAITSSSGGSGSSSLWKTEDRSRHKRKSREIEESECQSDATELESASGNKSSQKSGNARRTRVAEVHNLSERRRRDRINEKMKALQELIPHSSKSDKASMLDEAIEYMKSLQLQLQLMWMGTGMGPMMLPGMQHYMARMGMAIGPAALPQLQTLMRIPARFPLVDQAIAMPPNQATLSPNPVLNFQNQMQNRNFSEQYANYMGFHPMQNASQPISMFNFGSHAQQKNQALGPSGNVNGSLG